MHFFLSLLSCDIKKTPRLIRFINEPISDRASNCHDVPFRLRHGEPVQHRSEDRAQKVEPLQHREGTSRLPGDKKITPAQLGCVVGGLQLFGQSGEPRSSDRSKQGRQGSYEEELSGTRHSGKGETSWCLMRYGDLWPYTDRAVFYYCNWKLFDQVSYSVRAVIYGPALSHRPQNWHFPAQLLHPFTSVSSVSVPSWCPL